MKAIILTAVLALFGNRTVPVDMAQRYATTIENVVQTEELPFHGRQAKERTALLLWSLAYHEAGIDMEAIEECRFKSIPGATQDHGKSVGVTQLYEGASWRGYTRQEICGNLDLQLRLGLRYLTEQVQRCRTSVESGLTGYNRNKCETSYYAREIIRQYGRALGSVQHLM